MSDYPLAYQQQNSSPAKQLNVVVTFEGTDIAFGLLPTYKKIRYGDPGIYYGEPGLVYGGLVQLGNILPLLSPNTNFTISQKIEPEQGRGSASTFTLELQDKDGYVTNFITPGQVFDDIMGSKLVKIYVGYQNTSFREDYFVVYRGYISALTCSPTKVLMQLTDPNVYRRQQSFFTGVGTVFSKTFPFLPAAVNVATDTFTVPNHNYSVDTKVTFGSNISLPGGIDFGAEYYVKNPTTNTFQLSLAWDGPVLDITSSGSGNLQVEATKITGVVSYDFAPSVVDVALNKIEIDNHGFIPGRQVTFSSTGGLPQGISSGQVYFVEVLDPNFFQISLTNGGLPIDLTSQGIGTHTVKIANAPSNSSKIPMAKTDGFVQAIMGPDGTYDSTLTTYIKINDEYMTYGPGDVFVDGIAVSRAARGTKAGEISFGDSISNAVQIQGNPMDLALKIMLSGWNGPCFSNVVINSFNETNLGLPDPPKLPNAIILPDNVDAIQDYGIAPGDYLYVTGSALNDGTYTVQAIEDLNSYPNKVIIVNETLIDESPTLGTMAVRSQYDTLPDALANKLKTYDVDVARWQDTKRVFFFQADCVFSLLQDSPISTKQFIESELLLPCGAYSVTRFGQLSVTVTKPPIIDGRSTFLNSSNVIEPQTMSVMRSLNNRRFFNEVQYSYDVLDDNSTYTSVLDQLDANSLGRIGVSSVLPIQSRGLKTALNAQTFIERRSQYLLSRYKDAAIVISLKTNWAASSQIEVGDVVPLTDQGTLFLSNLETGTRDIGAQLFEVIERTLDIKSGQASLTLMSQLGYQITDRFATISPSSLVDIGSTQDRIRIKDSFGKKYPGFEGKKWIGFEGLPVRFHSYDYSYQEVKTFTGMDPADPYVFTVDPPFTVIPPVGTIIDIGVYDDTNPAVDQLYKLSFCFIDPTLTVVTGTSATVFDVSPADAAKLTVGLPVKVHNADYSRESSEQNVDSIVGTTVTLSGALEFVPLTGDLVELVGFKDGLGPYRLL